MEILQENQLKYTSQSSYSALLQQFLFNDLDLHRQNILVLGNSDFLTAFANSDNYITYLNASAKTQLSACAYFSLLAEGNTVYQDPNKILRKKYDVIIANLPKNQPQTLNQLLNYAYLKNLRQALAMHGIAIFNIE